MKRNILLSVTMLILCICWGCGAEIEEDEDYDEMVETYNFFTVETLWDALENDEDYSGSYILVQGVVLDVDVVENLVFLIAGDTSKTVECEFSSSMDLTDLEEVLDNNDDCDDEDVVTIAGICRYYEYSTSYPYLDSCDYFYVNDDE